MYICRESKWNQLDTINISNDQTTDNLVIALGFGAAILELSLSAKTWIRVEQDFPDSYRFQSAILSPFPNKIKNGKYTFLGKGYSLKKNDMAKRNAAHGLLYNKSFVVESIDCSGEYASVCLGYTYDHDDDGYPFKYHFSVSYLLQADSLEIVFRTTNLSSRHIPYGMGFHPYFQVGCPRDEIRLTIPKCEKLLYDSENFPTGDRQDCDYFLNGNHLDKDTTFNDCFHVGETVDKFSVDITPRKNSASLKVWFETGKGKFKYFQLYVPEGIDEIAVEPMTCAPNAFNNKEGIILLDPDETMECKMGLFELKLI